MTAKGPTRPLVLVVDDEALVRRALRRELEQGFAVVEAGGPSESLAALDREADIVAVVTDLNMAGDREAGFQLLAVVQTRHPGCVRILVSGSLSAQLGAAPAEAHCTIAKPWRPGEILAAVRRLLPP